jgi:hypothetical protein
VKARAIVLLLAGLGLLAGLISTSGTSLAAHGPNRFSTVPIRASSPAWRYVPAAVGPNKNVTNKAGAQSETAVAVDPTDGKHQLTSSNDLSGTQQVYESFDRGLTWTLTNFGSGNPFCYDPWVAFNAAGDAFVGYECSDQRIAYRKVGQATWTKTILAAGSFPDRDMVVADNTATSPFAGSVYVGYDDNGNNNSAQVMYSRDGFGGWVKSPKINDAGSNPTIGVNAAVAPDGTLYATWEDYSGKKIWTDKSTNGGATWSTDHVVTNYRINTTTFFISIPPQPNRGVLPMPMTTVGPAGTPCAGRLFVTYFDKAPASSNTNIYERYSDDGGATWSAEIQVNDGPTTAWHFHPAIAVGSNGTLGISFYDTRNDPLSKKTDQYIAFSNNCGVSFGANQKITTAMSDESGNGDPNDYGDYQNLAAGKLANGIKFFQAVWTDSRIPGAQAEDMFTASAKP